MMRRAVALMCLLVAAGCSDAGKDGSRSAARPPQGPCDERVATIERDLERDAAMVKVFLRDSHDGELQRIADRLENIEGVQRARAITKEQALEDAADLFADSPEVLENLPGNPFPAAIELTVDPERKAAIARDARRLEAVDDVGTGSAAATVAMRAYVKRYRDGDAREVCAELERIDPSGDDSDHDS